jgi:hypothetical protein
MRLDVSLRLLFVVYCFEAGVFLLAAPWMPTWDRTMVQLPLRRMSELLLEPSLRGTLSGFGVVHLVWGLHDVVGMIGARRRPDAAAAS